MSEEQGNPEQLHYVELEKLSDQVLGKITVFRHGQAKYEDSYPDLTDLGIERVQQLGGELKSKIDREREDVLLASSPRHRAVASRDFVGERIGIPDEERRIIKRLRSLEMPDRERAMKIIMDHYGPEEDIRKVDRAFMEDPVFEDPEIFEPRSKLERRIFQMLEYTIRAFDRYEHEEKGKIPHLVAASHFELLNFIPDQVFRLGASGKDYLQTAESIEFTLLRDPDISKRVRMLIGFRGEEREVAFNREKRILEIPEGNA